MKRKFLAVVMTMTMVMALSACGKSAVLDEPVAEATVEEAVEAATEASVEEVAEATAEESTEETEDEGEFSIGSVVDNAYVNEYFGVKLNLLDGYSFVDDETLAQITGMTSDILSDNKLATKAIEDGTAAIIAYATNESGLSNINVTAQSNATLANAILDEEAVLTASVGQAQAALEAQGISNITYEIVEREVAGETHKVLKMSGEYSGVEFHNEMVNLQKGDYMLAFAATCFNEDACDELIDALEKID